MVSCSWTVSKRTKPWRTWLKIDEEGSIDYEWTSGFIVPQELIDILCTEPSNDTSEEEDLTTEADNMIDVVYEDESDDEDP